MKYSKNPDQTLRRINWLVDSGTGNHICNNFELFDTFEPLNESIRVANGSTMRIIGKGSIKLPCKRPNQIKPFLLQLKDVYFIPECTVNLISASQLGLDSIAFDSEIPCLRAFSSREILCSIAQVNRYYVLDTVQCSKPAFFLESDNFLIQGPLELGNYLILDPLEHKLL